MNRSALDSNDCRYWGLTPAQEAHYQGRVSRYWAKVSAEYGRKAAHLIRWTLALQVVAMLLLAASALWQVTT
jgi:hypothetical protein